MNAKSLKSSLEIAITQLNVEINVSKLVLFLELLIQWNKVYNLTAITDPQDLISKHIMDSLVIHSYISGPNVIDVGTGAGFPGIPLAVLMPQCHFTLLDSNHKKTTFLQHVAQQLALKNITVVNQRAENFRPSVKYDTVVTRAFSSLSDMLRLTKHLCLTSGHFVAMKGKLSDEELALLCQTNPHYRVEQLMVPGLEATRHCVIIAATNQGTAND